jgi:glycosyltransferase involved in cell wall biosynthesis
MIAVSPRPTNWLVPEQASVTGLVSVIIPNYNHGRYLPDAINSVLQQRYEQVEIVVVDDGSTDDSRQIAARYGEQIRTIWQENQGLSAARNNGLRAAQGEYIALLDADDMLEADFLTTLIGLLQANPAADGVMCGYRFVDDGKNPLPQTERRELPPDALHTVLLDGNFLVPESILLRRYCYAVGGPFDETLRACEDWDMWLRISQQFTIISTPRLLSRHRVLPGSMSSNPQRMLSSRLIVLNRHLGAEPKDAAHGNPTQRRVYARAYFTSATEYLQVRDVDQAFYCLNRMAEIAPDMLTELDVFYELALGDQPKGWRGDYLSLDLDWSEQVVAQLLTRLVNELAAIRPYRQTAYAQFHYALALLYYGARQFVQARRHLGISFLYRPRKVTDHHWRTTLLKSLVPARVLHALRSKRAES